MEEQLLQVMKDSINEILTGLYDSVRIIEMSTHDQYVLNSTGKIAKQDISCHEYWDRSEPCRNCIGQRVTDCKCTQEKVEVHGGKIYLVVGMHIAEGQYIIEIVKDITNLLSSKEEIIYHYEALRQELEQLAQNAFTDALTGIWNRRYIEERFPVTLEKAEKLEKKVAVFMSDIDHFKRVNDTYGHTNGDEVLRRVARILQRGIRGKDAAVRYGGEEFAVILYDVPEEVAVRVAERIREQVSKEIINLQGEEISVTISTGVAFSQPGLSTGDLLTLADKRLYHAKQTGRNRVVWQEQ